ncbi:biopolymer transporter TolR [Hydrotalea sp.]|uniref:TolB family protein n=1 Tax=Hydrotalea sp. TaxID=2881279 RepID=UPI002588F663|nr:biopolymer transporter TolR [Hydrotalea sp.]
MKKCITIFVLFIMLQNSKAQTNHLGIFERNNDVGNTLPGNAIYKTDQQEYIVTGSGSNIWFNHDGFHFLWKKISGDFIVRTNVVFLGKGVEAHRKTGWMVRNTLDSTSAMVAAALHGDGLTSLQFRKNNNENIEEKRSANYNVDVIQLERKGNLFIMSVAKQGNVFTRDTILLNLAKEVYVGLFICAHNPAILEKALFYNVRIIKPASALLVPYKEYLGSNLETMEVSTGKRKIIYHSSKSIQAPNWMKDGKSLIYNGDGLLYHFNLITQLPTVLNTGSIIYNNNDHVLSFDGKKIGISSYNEQGVSLIYTLPSTGGEPELITPTGPSYLHGWSPDGKWLTFTGQRNNEFDIYKIPAKGGKEIKLTNTPGLDDGPEYAPSGKYIYFNSVRTGRMQIWRMKPDGTEQVQLTNDIFNNWFPHVSPDGKWIVFISFEPDVNPSDHPFYKQVYLRLMPVNGGQPKVIAYVYGGQGTINTPSWSPDGKYIAFISNSN